MTNTKYNFNEIDPTTYLSSYKDEDGNTVYFSNYNNNSSSIENVNPLEVLKDFNLPRLRRKYQRPYFSPCHNSWEMDYVIVPYPSTSIRLDRRKFFFYLFVININTKYLVVSSSHTKNAKHVIDVLKYMKHYLNIEHVKGDYDKAFVAKETYKYLRDNNINYYFTMFKYTNRNRVVDRVIRTIRDMVDRLGLSASLLNEELVQEVVKLYNHTKHCAFNNKFTPTQAQYNPEVETWFISKQESKLADIDLSPFKGYKDGDFLLVHMPYREINYKRRRTFNELAIFRGYRGGNVLVELCIPTIKLKNNKIKYPLYVLPMWCTKYVGSSIDELPNVVKNYYNYYLK